MSLINRYSITEKGSMIFTGNTLGLTNNNLDMGAFITLDTLSQVSGFPMGSTLVWQNNGSQAQFSLPVGSTVLYAELQWGGRYNGSVINDLDTPIILTTPSSTYNILPDSITAQEGPIFYTRSQDITSIIQSDGDGVYTVEGVPASINTITDAAGWTLGIIYENPSFPYQNMTIFSGIEEVNAGTTLDFDLSGFITPFIGPVEGRVLVSAIEGDLGFGGDQMLFGPNTGTLIALSGPNNNVNNFFESQINDGDSESATVGQLDTSGTFGTINVPTNNPARYSWDITNVLSTNFVNNQTDAVVRLTSISDGYAVPLMGIQLDAIPIDFGDAPNTNTLTQGPGNYRSLQASDGPIHIIDTNLRLGNQVTPDVDAQQNILADGDDQIRSIPDDGTTLPLTPMAYYAASYSIDVTVNNNTGSNANVYAWLDFNQDGIFQTNEGTTTVVPTSVSPQNITLTFTRPAGAPTPIGNTYIRVRTTTDILNNTGGATDEDTRSFGLANDGEVEDYFLPLTSEPFNCEPFGYRVAVPNGGTNSSLTQINLVTGEQVIINNDLGLVVNSIGYNTLDNLIYGTEIGTTNLVVIDSAGNVGNLGPVPNLPTAGFIGAIDDSGHLFVKSGGATYYVIDVDTTSPTFGQLVDPTSGFVLDTAPYGTAATPNISVNDWSFNEIDGLLYGVSGSNLARLDPTTGVTTIIPTTGLPSGSYGSIYSVNDQFIYATNNTTGVIYRIETDGTTAEAIEYSQDIPSGQNDGASCLNAELLIDFGDAPNNYKTLLADDGPRHGIVNRLILGSQVTDEDDAYISTDALGDDQINGIQDDGTSLPLTNMAINASDYTITETVLNDTGVDANVYAWIDFNKDGIFQTNEGTAVVVPSSPVPQNIDLTFTVPGTTALTPGDTYLRVRVTTDDLVNTGGATDEDTRSFGPATDGEVEDYLLTIEDVNIISTKSVDPAFADLGDTLTYTVTLTNPGTIPVDDVLFTDPLPSGVTYANNLMVDALYTGVDPMTGLTITTINPGQTVTISWDVKVDDTNLPNPNPIVNVGTVTIPTLPPDPTPVVSTKVNNATLIVVKNADKETVGCGQPITYTIQVTNTGNVDANPAVVTDILPSRTTYISGSLLIDGSSNPGDPSMGIDIGPVSPGQTITILFAVTVDENESLPIENTASVDYEYIVDPNEPPVEKTAISNTIQVDVASVEVIKSVDKEFIQSKESITYTNTITSTGNASIENIIFTDIPPIQTTYVNPSVTINGTLYPAVNPNNPIDLGSVIPSLFPLQQDEFIVVKYRVSVDDIPSDPVISNTSSVEYEYLDGTEVKTCEEESNEVVTTVRDGELVLEKSVDKDIVEVGDTLTYTLTATNTGNIDVDNAIITDEIPPQTEFVEGSVVVDKIPRPTDNPATGINIGTVNPSQTVTITFSVLVTELPQSGEIINTASASYEVTVDPNKPPVTETTDSNEVVTKVVKVELLVIKNCMPKDPSLGDEVTYSFVIINTGSIDIDNIKLFDSLPNGVEFVEGSFIGSIKPTVVASDLEIGVDIGNLSVGEQKRVSFKVKVIKQICPPTICNTGSITVEYEIIENETLTKSFYSNECCIDISNNSFKQTYKDGKVTIPEEKPDIESIISVDVIPQIINVDTIDSPIGKSQYGQNLSGKKILACIKLCITVTYVSVTEEQSVHSAHFEVSDCDYIVIPQDTEGCDCSSANIDVEDIYYEMIDSRNVFYNITYLVITCC